MQQRNSVSSTMDSNSEDGADRNVTPPPAARGRQNSKLKVLVRSHAMREEASPPREPTICIQLTPSPESNEVNPMVVVSPSISRTTSPTSTLVASPNSRCSPQCASSPIHATSEDHQSSHSNKKRLLCDCQNQNCIKCIKNQERNFNNNLANNINNNVVSSSNTLSVSRSGATRAKLKQQSSSQGSFESCNNSPCLSRDSSSEYTDTTGVDLELFIPETLNRNAKDRALMLRIEQELVNLAKDRNKLHYKFPPMSSYQRMLVHRCAAYFGMDHNIEASGKCVVVNKTKNTRIPDIEFKEHIKEDLIFYEEPRRSILKRDSNSMDDYSFKSPDRSFNMDRRSKSIEERAEEYEKVRRRIFNNRELHDNSSEDFGWSEMPWSSTESEYSARLRLPPPDIHHRRYTNKLIKVQSEETGETMRPCVAKSYSFGGYGGAPSVLSRGDSVMSTHSAGPRLLTKQDSAASSVSWRLSPSSSGYKSQSQMSESVTPSPTSTPHPVMDSSDPQNSEHIVWAVTAMQNVPKGSVIINPQTGKPVKNDDGSLYHYDPNNPPPSFVQTLIKEQQEESTRELTEKQQDQPQSFAAKRGVSMRKLTTLTNSSTSPILPYSPPVANQPQVFHFAQQPPNCNDNVTNVPQPFVYGSAYHQPPPPPDPNIQVYQQPYIVYSNAPYGVPQYDNRIEQEIPSTYYVPDNTGAATAPAMSYQQPYWNQQQSIAYYNAAPSTPPQRYPAVPIQNQAQSGYFAHAPPTTELVPLYPNQPVQMIYPNQSNPPTVAGPPNTVIYHSQPPMMYSHNSVYSSPSNPMFSPVTPQSPYPQNTSTPNSCISSISNNIYGPTMPDQSAMMHLAQNMQQMQVGTYNKSFDNNGVYKTKTFVNSKTNKLNGLAKNFIMCSSQSSTGTNSPAATVVAVNGGYCPQQSCPPMYKTPPETPPTHPHHQHAFNFPPNYNAIPPMIFRQVSNNIRVTTPVTARNSRSPTPASDISHFDRQRMSLPPPNMYQGMPYVLQPDTRLIPGRGQPNAYRQHSPVKQQHFNQVPDARYYKGNRKYKGNKPGLPPSGKPI